MKESIGNAFVFGVFVVFAFLTMLILTFAINYSRASKIKNRLVNYVQTYAENSLASGMDGTDFFEDEEFMIEVDLVLSKAGYRMKDSINRYDTSCPTDSNEIGRDAILMSNYSSNYDYCIYAYPTSRGYFYKIITYMYLDIPIIGEGIKFPISGETRTIYNLGDR